MATKKKIVDSPGHDRLVSPERQRLRDPVRGDRVVTAYNPAMALEICELVAGGATLRQILAPGEGFVSTDTFRRWRLQQPELARAYHEARVISSFEFEEESIDMLREIRANPGSAQRVRAFDVAMNHLRWVAARRNPQTFSEKAAIKITVPIQINTNLDLGEPSLHLDKDRDGNSIYKVEAVIQEEVVDVDAKPLLEGGKVKKKSLTRIKKEKEDVQREADQTKAR